MGTVCEMPSLPTCLQDIQPVYHLNLIEAKLMERETFCIPFKAWYERWMWAAFQLKAWCHTFVKIGLLILTMKTVWNWISCKETGDELSRSTFCDIPYIFPFIIQGMVAHPFQLRKWFTTSSISALAINLFKSFLSAYPLDFFMGNTIAR